MVELRILTGGSREWRMEIGGGDDDDDGKSKNKCWKDRYCLDM